MNIKNQPTETSSTLNEPPASDVFGGGISISEPQASSYGRKGSNPWFRLLKLLILLYLFFVSVKLMSGSFKMFSSSAGYKDEFKAMIAVTAHPIVGLCLGILITAVLQSSSTTTSMIVAAVAEGSLPMQYAIPMVMGANIGTTVTSTLVSLGHVTRIQEFRRAYAAATVHDFFNLLAVGLLLPFELMTGFLEKTSILISRLFENVQSVGTYKSPFKKILDPVVHLVKDLVTSIHEQWAPFLMMIFALALLMLVLKFLSSTLKEAISGQVEKLINGYLFAKAWRALIMGALVTMAVQSSSISTSLTVPLVAGGILTLDKMFPFILGANIGTTITALLAAMALSGEVNFLQGLQVALVHLMFNLAGTAIWIWHPANQVPITMARKMADIAVRFRALAIIYLVVLFYLIPIIIVFIF